MCGAMMQDTWHTHAHAHTYYLQVDVKVPSDVHSSSFYGPAMSTLAARIKSRCAWSSP